MLNEENQLMIVEIEITNHEWEILGALAVMVLKNPDSSEMLSVIDLFNKEVDEYAWDVSPGRPLGASLLDASTVVHKKMADILLRQGRLP